ncbi:hypothetical protein QYM36_008235 [Artemia franciscana]|uniref:Uncharacterized protein n=1 Tax=Artemia franciscana TaxID=6661 RepID=A0AA88LHV9_ARTSF|nr:hypothetical protein QYM36_008235 [Artemia franciscana]
MYYRKAEERKIQKYLENSRVFAYDMPLAPSAVTLLDLPFAANSLTQDEFMDAVSLISELAKFSYQFWKDCDSFNKRSEADFVKVLNTELCSYISESGPFSKSLYFGPAKAVELGACCSLPHDSGDGMAEDDLPYIAFEDVPDEEEEQLLQ